MGGAGTAANARRAGKYNKPTRGGGKHFSRGLQPVDAEGVQVSMWGVEASEERDSDEDQESDSDEKEDGDGEPSRAPSSKFGPTGVPDAVADRDSRKAQKKARKEAAIAKTQGRTVEAGDLPSSDDDDDSGPMLANPNHSKAARDMASGADKVDEITDGIKKMKAPASRREREAMEAAAAKERYLKLQAQGKTDEAKADLARLKIIREQREAEAARKQAEKEEKEEKESARRAEIEAREARRREAAAGPKKTVKKK